MNDFSSTSTSRGDNFETQNLIVIQGYINPNLATMFGVEMEVASNSGETHVLLQNTEGGDLRAGLDMGKIIKHSGSTKTFGEGYVQSSATFPLSAGSRTFVTEGAQLMYHRPEIIVSGGGSYIEIQVEEIRERYQDKMQEFFATTIDADSGLIEQLISSEDRMRFSGSGAVENGLIDAIGKCSMTDYKSIIVLRGAQDGKVVSYRIGQPGEFVDWPEESFQDFF